jgi:hypothetical protein
MPRDPRRREAAGAVNRAPDMPRDPRRREAAGAVNRAPDMPRDPRTWTPPQGADRFSCD